MIKSFKHKGLKKFYLTSSVAGIQAKHAKKLKRILASLEYATQLADLNAPDFRLHPLSNNRKGVWSIWVNGNWRVTFKFNNGEAQIINYEDYH